MRFSSRSRNTVPLPKGCAVMIGIAFALLGIVLLAGGLAWWLHVSRFVQSAEHTEGTVIEIVEKRDREGGITFSPVVEFTDHQGQQRKYYSNTSSNPSSYSVGDKVEILYDRDRPDSAGINSWFDLYIGTLVLVVLGGGFFFVGTAVSIVMMFSKSPKKPKDDPMNNNPTNNPMNDPMMEQPPEWNETQ